MNSQIFVQAPTGLSKSELATPLEVLAGNPQQPPSTVPVPAIVRPYRYSDSPGSSARVDASSEPAISGPHQRTHKLEDYVNWLKARVAADRVKAPTELDAGESNDDLVRPAASTPPESHRPQPEVTFADDQETSATDPSTRIQRIDSAHSAIAKPITSASKFQTTDVDRIESRASQPKADDAVESEAVRIVDEDTAVSDIHSPQSTFVDSGIDADRIIATVSQAIASVLTGQTEEDIEARIRAELEQPKHWEALESLPPQVAQQIVSEVQSSQSIPTDQDSTATIEESHENSTEIVSEQLPVADQPHPADAATDAQVGEPVASEIPTTIAAWDVEDFRWPKVTSQMIVTGAKAIEQLVESVDGLMDGSPGRLAVTSSGRGEGATSIAISLSRWAAATGKSVLLVDADLASPGLSSQIGLGPNISWVNAVSSDLDPAEVIIRSQKSRLCVMPMAPIVTRVSWPRFIYDLLGDLTSQVQSSFDLIIYDVGPVSQLPAELSQSLRMVDVGLLVHSDTASPRFQKSKEILDSFGITKYVLAQNSAVQQKVNVA